jgi:hypothetical protein
VDVADQEKSEPVEAARAEAAEIADQALRGDISMLLGARRLARLRRAVDVGAADPDFLAFYAVDSMTDDLPLEEMGVTRDLAALRDYNDRCGGAEAWSRHLLVPALQNVRRRFR